MLSRARWREPSTGSVLWRFGQTLRRDRIVEVDRFAMGEPDAPEAEDFGFIEIQELGDVPSCHFHSRGKNLLVTGLR
jgi:hypothetical protein